MRITFCGKLVSYKSVCPSITCGQMLYGLLSDWIWRHNNLIEKIVSTNMPKSSSRKTFYWIRESKSLSSTCKQTVWKGFHFQFPHAYKNGNFRLHWYALRDPILTKAFPCPCNLDQKRPLEVKQLVWIQNRP